MDDKVQAINVTLYQQHIDILDTVARDMPGDSRPNRSRAFRFIIRLAREYDGLVYALREIADCPCCGDPEACIESPRFCDAGIAESALRKAGFWVEIGDRPIVGEDGEVTRLAQQSAEETEQ